MCVQVESIATHGETGSIPIDSNFYVDYIAKSCGVCVECTWTHSNSVQSDPWGTVNCPRNPEYSQGLLM